MIDYFTKALASATTLYTKSNTRENREGFKQAIRDWVNVIEGFEPQETKGIGKIIVD